MRRFAVAFLLFMMSALSMADGRAPLRFVTEAAYPPFEYFDNTQTLQGFDIELAQAICQHLQRRCEFVHQSFDTLLYSVMHQHVDAAISALDITDARKKAVAFSDPYFDNRAVFVVRDKTQQDIAAQSSIAVQQGSALQTYLQEQRRDLKVLSYPTYQLALNDLMEKKVDGVFIDAAAAQYWLGHHDTLHVLRQQLRLGQGLGIAVHKDNARLLRQINRALAALKNNGHYVEIYEKYFSRY